MAWTQSDLDKIRAAMVSGVRSFTFADGRKQEYQTLDQLMALERVVSTQLQVEAQTLSGKKRSSTPFYRSGL